MRPGSRFQPDGLADQTETELGVRRALGLDGAARPSHSPRMAERHGADRPRRAFVQDGAVDVVVVQGRRSHGPHALESNPASLPSPGNRVELAETALKAEREARERAERSLVEAQNVIRELQTKLGHTALAVEEAQDAARQARLARQEAEQALDAERQAHKAPAPRVPKAAKPEARPKAARPKQPKSPAQKPVKWWIKPKAAVQS